MVISDLSSGLNYKKKGLTKLLKLIINNQIETILNEVENKSFESTLAEDVIELMTVFSAKLYGKRSHKNKNLLTMID